MHTEKVKHCIELATLAPNNSNMQLWEFYHITDKQLIQKMAYASLSQNPVASANQLVVLVTRGDLHRSRYDTCPIEGFDSQRVKKLLNLPSGAEINMLIPCSIRSGDKAIHGERFRVPFNQVYKNI